MVKATEIFDVDGARVELSRVSVRQHSYNQAGRTIDPETEVGAPKEQALYEIRVDGRMIGHASRPHGWGKQAFKIERVGSGYDTTVYPQSYHSSTEWLFDLSQVATTAVRLRNERRFGKDSIRLLPTEEEWKAHCKAEKRRAAREEAEAEENRKRWRLEDEARRTVVEQARLDILGGLQSINERLGLELTNYEANALREAIQSYTTAKNEG